VSAVMVTLYKFSLVNRNYRIKRSEFRCFNNTLENYQLSLRLSGTRTNIGSENSFQLYVKKAANMHPNDQFLPSKV